MAGTGQILTIFKKTYFSVQFKVQRIQVPKVPKWGPRRSTNGELEGPQLGTQECNMAWRFQSFAILFQLRTEPGCNLKVRVLPSGILPESCDSFWEQNLNVRTHFQVILQALDQGNNIHLPKSTLLIWFGISSPSSVTTYVHLK